jgi:hypothetical protein
MSISCWLIWPQTVNCERTYIYSESNLLYFQLWILCGIYFTSMFSTFPYLLLTAISFLVLEAFTGILMGSCISNHTLIGKMICMIVCFLLGDSPAWILYADVLEHTVCSIFIGRQVGVMTKSENSWGSKGRGFGLKIAWTNSKEDDGVGVGLVTEQVMKG